MTDPRAAEVERATRDLCDALERLEALGQAPYPVGDPSGRGRPPAHARGGARGHQHPPDSRVRSPPRRAPRDP
ncbi:hypothetical protein AAHZ94_20595, partial [Streptomyces sp. HSW2009]|uniref:hypothetical protein n=1 Tax=Streptomyces sp. HSW2009 TaxID=3142890 RepID=UPI0032EE596C